MYRLGVVAGDMRMKYMYEALVSDGYDTVYCTDTQTLPQLDVVVLPIGMSAKGVTTPIIFGSVNEQNVINYTANEYFKARNALPTAEGALRLAMENTPSTISGSRVTVIGYGYCGKAIADRLYCLDADVTVIARNESSRAVAENCGLKSAPMDMIANIPSDIIFNTVPTLVLTKPILRQLDRSTLIIDIASKPGGVDFDAAEKLGIKTLHALGIPGKYTPRTAGEILKTTVLSILSKGDLKCNKK